MTYFSQPYRHDHGVELRDATYLYIQVIFIYDSSLTLIQTPYYNQPYYKLNEINNNEF